MQIEKYKYNIIYNINYNKINNNERNKDNFSAIK